MFRPEIGLERFPSVLPSLLLLASAGFLVGVVARVLGSRISVGAPAPSLDA